MSTDAQSTLDLGLVSILNEKFGISDFFPVQEAVVSFLKDEKNRDLCVSAPTGSGKTLSYVLPIVDAIKDRFLQRLQAIVIVPTKDLVSQVKEAFMPFCRSLGLKAAAFNGSLSFKEEQKLLGDADVLASRSEYSCHIDILVTTPNRLVDHFASTRGFDLLHVRFVVFDEADRLFGEPSRTWYDLLADRLRRPEASPLDFAQPFRFPLQRLLFSATLSRNEAKYSELKLHNPHVIHISPVKYSTPSTLREFYAIASDTQKGALLIYLLTVEFQSKKILCFTNSVSATEKLGYLISQLPAVSTIATFSGDKGIQERNRIIAGFNSGTIRAYARPLYLPVVLFALTACLGALIWQTLIA